MLMLPFNKELPVSQVKAFIFMPVAPALSQDNVQNNNMQISEQGTWEKERHTNPFLFYWSHANKDTVV